MPRRSSLVVLLAALALGPAARADAPPTRSLDDYRRFRALSIDLVGRMPTRAELAAFERADFSWDRWLDDKLAGPGYVDRMTRVWLDVLRLELGPAVQYAPPSATLKRQQILGPDGKPAWVYYRSGQRRLREATDGEFCLTQAEAGFVVLPNGTPVGEPRPVDAKALDAATRLVRPWWLYRDWLASRPSLRYREGWTDPDPLFQPVDDLLTEPDRKTPTTEVRVCREEAQLADSGTVYASGRKRPPGPPAAMTPAAKQQAPSGAVQQMDAAMHQPPRADGRVRPPPFDDPWATQHAGEPIACSSALALTLSIDCGCGQALERCMPGDSAQNDPRAFALPTRTPLGLDAPLGNAPQPVSAWSKLWWAEEARRFLGYVFAGDRDFREVLTGRYTFVNGPLVHFYRELAPAGCCNRERFFGMQGETEPLVDPKILPTDLFPSDAHAWRLVPDRGPHAAGLLTMPVFLTKYASRRARGAVLYQAFLCKSFVAGKEALAPSSEPDLTKRQGCAACHATLEPLAAYFARVEETGWTYLPEWSFPTRNFKCKKNAQGKLPGFCDPFYDVAFSDGTAGLLRGAYASIDHAAAGPTGAAAAIVADPAFARCTVERVTGSLLGRPLGDDDAALVARLTDDFVRGGYHLRPLVRAIVTSPEYQDANNRSSTTWRAAVSQ